MSAVLQAQTFIGVKGGGMTYTLINRVGLESVHDIRVDSFQMAATEVSVAQWRKFTDDTGMEFPWEHHYCGDISVLSPFDNCPIQLVRIEEAVYFCNWLSLQDGLEIVYVDNREGTRIIRNNRANGYRIPTTAEWDYAARGGRKSRGYLYAGSNNSDEVAWFNYEFEDGTKPVATKAPNELGLYDMSGNIREWTWPVIGIPYPNIDPEEKLHIRGGSWSSVGNITRLDYDRVERATQWSCNGFRLAKNAE
ncbi:MAG: SUMF1/EgtB/PvdO family nonheme iron enzyme [Spirochaetaceae bacterium]|nr:SUMF1/EgtB/PvdO family nonheme iron enzyme [Spirochaetaceae bacterium]